MIGAKLGPVQCMISDYLASQWYTHDSLYQMLMAETILREACKTGVCASCDHANGKNLSRENRNFIHIYFRHKIRDIPDNAKMWKFALSTSTHHQTSTLR